MRRHAVRVPSSVTLARGVASSIAAVAIIAAVAAVAAAGATGATTATDAPLLGARQARMFQQTCARCHAQPGIDAPLVGDSSAWADRRGRGFDALVASTVNGTLRMPPLGTCGACTEDDLRRLVAYVAGFGALPDAAESGE